MRLITKNGERLVRPPMTELDAMRYWIGIASYESVSEVDKERLRLCLAQEMAAKERLRFKKR